MIRLTILLSDDASNRLNGSKKPNADLVELQRIVESISGSLRPMHQSNDPRLKRYYYLDIPDRENIDGLQNKLSANKAVEACYLKPLDEPP